MKAKLISCVLLFLLAGASAPARGQAAGTSTYRLALAQKDWAFDLTVPTPPSVMDTLGDDRRSRTLFFGYNKNGEPMSLFIRLAPAPAAGGAAEFRDFAVKRLKDNGLAHSFKLSEYNHMPVASYRLDGDMSFGGSNGSYAYNLSPPRVLAAYMANDGVWAEFYIVKKEIKADDEKFFYSILDSAKVTDTSSPSTSFDFYWKGKPFYLGEDFKKAVEYYGRAFELEQKERRLDTDSWRTLVKELTEAHGATSDLGRARETLELAVLRDPTYPWFHYYLARVHAFRGDIDNAIASLERAFANKENAGGSDPLPAPLSDSTFKSFWKDEKFRNATRKMKRTKGRI
ncbi:MAG TPA: hypothetical protein VM914_07915 [Pyrinomonadaceae bacterium]|jgi:tetratricopeptide (TPR) repeat protein|nr:hypothetical protein [Pyrinomonadaceae bacterium]